MSSGPPATNTPGSAPSGSAAGAKTRRRAVLAGLVVLAAITTWTVAYPHSPRALVVVDAHDYAQMGRQIVRGEGFTSLQSFPYLLGWLSARGLPTTPPWPNVTRFPLATLASAGTMAVVGEGHLGAVLPGCLFLTATALVVFLLGDRLFGPLAGVTAAGATFLTPGQIEYSLYGLSQTGAGFFIAAAALALCAVRDSQFRSLAPAAVLGVVLGLAALQRTNLVLLVPASVLALVWVGAGRRLAGFAAIAGGFAIAVAPWVLRNSLIAGSPTLSLDPNPSRMFLLGIETSDPFASFEQRAALPVVLANLDAVFAKLAVLLQVGEWPRVFGGEITALLPLFALGGFLVRGTPAAPVFWFGLSAFAMNAVLFAATLLGPKYLQPFQPLLWTIVAGAAIDAANRVGRMPRWLPPAAAAALLTGAAFTSVSVLGPRMARLDQHQDGIVGAFARLGERVAPGALVASSASWMVAWNADRATVRFGGDVDQLAQIDRYARVGAVLLDARRAKRFRAQLATSPLAEEFREVNFVPAAGLWLRRGSNATDAVP